MAAMQMLERYTHLRAEDLIQLHRIPWAAPSASTNRLKLPAMPRITHCLIQLTS